MPGPDNARVVRLVALLSTMGAVALVASAAILWASPPPAEPLLVVGALAFVAAFILLERTGVTFAWREHRFRTSLTEGAVLVAYVAFPPTLVVILVGLSLAVVQALARRNLLKASFNVAHGVLAAAAGAAILVAAPASGASLLAVAILAAIVYAVVNEGQVAALFAFLEDVPPMRIYRERLVFSNALTIGLGIPTGVAIVAMWRLHPLAIVTVVPLALLVQRYAALTAQADRELGVRRRLANDSMGLVGVLDRDAIAGVVLRSATELLDAGRVRLELEDGSTWQEGSGDAPGRAPLEAPLRGRDGAPLGRLFAWQRPLRGAYRPEDRALLEVVAGVAAHAFETAAAVDQLSAQREVIARQEKLSALGTLMAGVAHEINNPLTYMRLRLATTQAETKRLLAREDVGPDARAYAESVQKGNETFARGIDRLATLCASLKSAARPGDGARHPTSLADVAREVVTIVRAAHKHAAWEIDLAHDAPSVHANPAEMHQVVLNLVKNAAEAVGERPDARIRVRAAKEGDHVVLAVEDNGPGIPEEAREKLFRPFYTTKQSGTGLGLSISHEIVTAHGGTMAFESNGHGTTFFVRLPVLARVVA